MSATGRYVAFTSESRNLLAGQPLEANFDNDVFVTDTTSGENLWVSYDYQEDEPAAGVSESPSISSDGRYISYFSSAENLVNGDSNGRMDVFRFDQATGETDLVSVATSPAGGNEHSGFPSISADGRYVAFYSVASNLVSNDTNNLADIFVRDMTAGTTTRVSVSTLGNQAQGGHSYYPAISADGRHVAFSSHANNLTLDDNNGSIQDVFAHDRQSGATQLISVSSAGDGGDAGSEFPSISGDGRYVAFHSSATTLWSGDGNGKIDVFLRDRTAGTTTLMSRVGTALGNGHSSYPDIDEAGQYVAFQSAATNLWLLEEDRNGVADIYEYDRMGDQIMGRLSVGPDDIWSDGASSEPAISNDNLTVAFTSQARDLVTGGDSNLSPDVFTHLWVEGRTKCQTDRRSDRKPIPPIYAPAAPDTWDPRCQDSTPGSDPDVTTDPFLVHSTAGNADTFTDNLGRTVHLRWGKDNPLQTKRNWGYRHVARKHGWGADVKADVTTTLADPDQVIPDSDTAFKYYWFYTRNNTSCTRKVLVEFTHNEWEPAEKGIITSLAYVGWTIK